MTIRQCAYALCKSIWSSSIRNAVLEIIEKRSTHDKPFFDYVSRSFRAQLLGYLVADRDRTEIAKSFLPLSQELGLSVKEKEIFLKTHKQIVDLNKMCIKPFLDIMPEFDAALDPYSLFDYQLPEPVEGVQLYDNKIADALIKSFRSHPALISAVAIGKKLNDMWPEKERPNPDLLNQSVQSVEKMLLDASPLATKRQLSDLALGVIPDSLDYWSMKFIFALTCVRASLGILDELLFQALHTDKLPVLDDNNIIKVMKAVTTLSGAGFSLKCQLVFRGKLGEYGLILIKKKIYGRELDLCRVEAYTVSEGSGFGDIADFSIRDIDENLNPYYELLKYP